MRFMSLRLPRKTKINKRLKIWAISSIIPIIKKAIILISASIKEKTSSNLGNVHVDDRKNGGKIETGILHFVFCHF